MIVYLTLKAASFLQDQFDYKFSAALHHNDELKAVLIHELYILFAKIPPVQDNPRILMPIGRSLIQHKLQLGYVVYAPRVSLIKQRESVPFVIRDGIVEDRLEGYIFSNTHMPVIYVFHFMKH